MLTRRELLALAGQVGLVSAVDRRVLAQGATQVAPTAGWGKDTLLVRSVRPLDYESPVALLDSFITPIEHFYVRSHLPVPPAIDAATFKLTVDGDVATPLSLTLDELKRMPAITTTVTLECAGNGRSLFDPPVAGVQWQKGAVGTARWTGVRMADVLKRAGVTSTSRNIVMNAADRPLGTMPDFTRQVPIAKATHADTVLAYEMNGQPIPQVHGFPLRAIIPGWEGAYSVKWLTSLTAIDTDFDGFWVATAYRYPRMRVAPGAAVDAKDMVPLLGLVVKSLITQPAAGSTVPAGKVAVGGFAWAGEADVTRVDISIDHGATWQAARLVGEQARYTWRRFEFEFAADTAESVLILSRATDSTGHAQPAVSHWNPSGYLWNQYDSVQIQVK